MPQMPIRKVKKAIVLTKRTQYLRKYYKARSCKPLYERLKSNNTYLAKALSHEKKNNQSLFTQNLALIRELQELRIGYNTQDNVITNVLNNAKEMLKMLVTMSGYMTNTISMCQEYVASNTTARISMTGRKDSSKRLSTKSPAKGVVKPMVSGHTITKPTINLSRVNININNASRLSDISEISTPTRNSINRNQINEDGSSIPMAITPLRYENNSARRMPERLVPSPRLNDTLVTNDERRLQRRKNRRSKRLSGSFSRSRSSRWSDETPRSSIGHINQVGYPTVKLTDVSKLLQNSHSINIRRLIDNVGIQENSNDAHHEISEKSVIIPEIQVSMNLDENETSASDKDSNVQMTNKVSDKTLIRHPNVTENLRPSQKNIWEEDPLEGPSWLFNNTLAAPLRDNEPEESNHLQSSDFNNNTSDIVEYDNDDDDDDSSVTENNLEELLPLNLGNLMESNMSTLEKDAVFDRTEFQSCLTNPNPDNSLCTILKTESLSTCDRDLDNIEVDSMNLSSFVTLRRKPSETMEEETEDFTLMLARQPTRNMQFNINELRLPTPEKSIINSNVDDELNTEEITMSNVTNGLALSSASNQNQLVISEYDHESISTSKKNKQSNKKNKKERSSSKDRIEHIESDSTMDSRAKQKSKSEKNRDPSAAKVVLKKLNESHVKQRMSGIDETESQNAINSVSIRSNMSNQTENPEDVENNANNHANRPRRRRAPTNFKEPSIKKKLRRSK